MSDFAAVVRLIGLVIGIYALAVWLFQLIWNLVMPAVFNLPELSFWLAAGIIFLLGFVGGLIKSK